MTSVERVSALLESVNYITTKKVPGAIVECGVWRGGSSMAALMKLKALGSLEREIYLYDTFEGMSEPTANDKSLDGVSAEKQLAETEQGTGVWCKATLEDVQANVGSTRVTGIEAFTSAAKWRIQFRRHCLDRSRCCDWTRTGTNQRGMSSSICSRC